MAQNHDYFEELMADFHSLFQNQFHHFTNNEKHWDKNWSHLHEKVINKNSNVSGDGNIWASFNTSAQPAISKTPSDKMFCTIITHSQ